LDASQAAQVLVARFLPLGNQVSVSNFLLQAVVVQLTTDGLASIEEVVHVASFLMVDFEDGPQGFVDAFAFVRFSFGCEVRR
jgi:hypothetical protein